MRPEPGEIIYLDEEEWRRFMDIMENPQPPSPAMREAARWHREFVAKQEPLGEPFATVLHDNLWDLMAR